MLLLDIVQIDAFDDGLLFFRQALQYPADFFKKELATRRFRRVLSVIAQGILQSHPLFVRCIEGHGTDGPFPL